MSDSFGREFTRGRIRRKNICVQGREKDQGDCLQGDCLFHNFLLNIFRAAFKFDSSHREQVSITIPFLTLTEAPLRHFIV